MDISQIEAFFGRARVKGSPTRHLLASLHRGDAFTQAFSTALFLLVWILGILIGLSWLRSWTHVYYEFERWELVLAFMDQFFLLGILCVVLQITYLRASHLRQIPPGSIVSMQATALLLRWVGECVLMVSIGALGHALLGVPQPGWLSWIFDGSANLGDLKAAVKGWSLLSSGWLQALGFIIFTCFYALASAIETFLAIERNSRDADRFVAKNGEVSGRGREVSVRQEAMTASI